MTKENIILTLVANSDKIKSFGVDQLGLFGSYAREQHNDQSDIDIIVKFQEGKKNYKSFINLVYFLEKLLGKQVDLLTFKSLTNSFLKHIEKDITYVTLDN